LRRETTFETFTFLLRDHSYEPLGLYNSRGLSQCNPQIAWLRDADGESLANHVARYEALDDLMQILEERFGVSGRLPRLNVSDRPQYRCYYSGVTRRNVELGYKEDLEAFDYDF